MRQPIFGMEPVRSVGLQICGLTLSLWCEGIAIPFCFLTRGGPAEYPGVNWTGHDPFLPGVAYRQQHLDENAAAAVPVVASWISGQFEHLAGTVMRFYWAGHKPLHLDAILDYAIAAEALLCRGATGQIGATFQGRAARLLSSPQKWITMR
jgi:hypothetical protein